jgi:undecaprenyl diphosphate synthase
MITKLKELVQEDTEEYRLAEQIDKKRIPLHVAVIMDGNGRWAKKKNLKREAGHKEGAVSAKKITEYALRCGVKYLTLFAFSSENWKRPITEVNTLMNMLYENLVEQKELLMENKIKLNIVGDLGRLPSKLRKKLQETIDISKDHKAMQLNLALNYGSRMEILNAVKRIIDDDIPARKIDDTLFKKYLYTWDCPDPDLLIRTSGELRISNFLLYQIAYSELHFTDIMWPEFRLKHFLEAILDFQRRERRFGKV